MSKQLAPNLLVDGLKDSTCIGFRYFYRNPDGSILDFRFEPLMADNNKNFFEGNYSCNNIDDYRVCIKNNYPDYHSNQGITE
jgi:hypothetical protein